MHGHMYSIRPAPRLDGSKLGQSQNRLLQLSRTVLVVPSARAQQASVAAQWLPAGAIGKKKKNARALYLDLTPATKVILSHICNGILWPTLSGTSLCYGRFGTCLTSGTVQERRPQYRKEEVLK